MFWLGVLVGLFLGIALVICGAIRFVTQCGKYD